MAETGSFKGCICPLEPPFIVAQDTLHPARHHLTRLTRLAFPRAPSVRETPSISASGNCNVYQLLFVQRALLAEGAKIQSVRAWMIEWREWDGGAMASTGCVWRDNDQ